MKNKPSPLSDIKVEHIFWDKGDFVYVLKVIECHWLADTNLYALASDCSLQGLILHRCDHSRRPLFSTHSDHHWLFRCSSEFVCVQAWGGHAWEEQTLKCQTFWYWPLCRETSWPPTHILFLRCTCSVRWIVFVFLIRKYHLFIESCFWPHDNVEHCVCIYITQTN